MSSKTYIIGLVLLLFVFSCKEGELLPNSAPETKLSIDSINLSGENRLNSTVRLSWYGTDIDGYIEYYEIRIGDNDWVRTQTQDSIFLFDIEPDQDSTDIEFYVRAIDNEGFEDLSPAYLKIPLINSIPEVTFDEASLPLDTTNLVITFRYVASDPDGNETLKKGFIRANEGEWTEIDLNQKLISLLPAKPTEVGIGDAKVYYGIDEEPALTIDGFNNGGDNFIQLKVEDIANTSSQIDSTASIFVRSQTSDLLVIGGHNAQIDKKYQDLVNNNYTSADFINYASNGGLNQPKFWNPNFRLLSEQYDKVFFHTDEGNFSNPLTGEDGKLLDFAAPIIQELIDNNQKVLISTAFATGTSLDIIGGVLSIDSFTGSRGQAFFVNDSFAKSRIIGFPDLQPTNFLLAVDPFYHSQESEILYEAQLTPNGGWYGPKTIAIQRKSSEGNVNLVLFTVEIHKLDKLASNQNQLISKLFNETFNW